MKQSRHTRRIMTKRGRKMIVINPHIKKKTTYRIRKRDDFVESSDAPKERTIYGKDKTPIEFVRNISEEKEAIVEKHAEHREEHKKLKEHDKKIIDRAVKELESFGIYAEEQKMSPEFKKVLRKHGYEEQEIEPGDLMGKFLASRPDIDKYKRKIPFSDISTTPEGEAMLLNTTIETGRVTDLPRIPKDKKDFLLSDLRLSKKEKDKIKDIPVYSEKEVKRFKQFGYKY